MRLQGKALQDELLKQLDEGELSRAEKARIRCQLSKEFEDAGNYEAAQGIFGDLWRIVGMRPQVEDFDDSTQAEVLMRAGALSGFIGQARQIEGAQEQAKDFISESLVIFEKLNDQEKVAEALTELGFCYWREGAYDNARATLNTALQKLDGLESDLKAIVTLRLAMVESSASHAYEALRILKDAEPLFFTSTSHALLGKYHMNLAAFLKNVSLTEKDTKYRDEALVEFAAASYHLREAGHTRYYARSENNHGFMLFTIGNFSEAHEHLDRAHRLFTSLKETSNAGQVDETRARAFLAEARSAEAVAAAQRAVAAQEKGDEQGLLAQSLMTYGISLARTNQQAEAKSALEEAVSIYEVLGEQEGAALASLTMLEELRDFFNNEKLFDIYRYADSLIGASREPEILSKLRNCANILLALAKRQTKPAEAPGFIHASAKISKLLESAKLMARTSSTVLIVGESGTGKEVLAKQLHAWSGRVGHLVAINCSNLTDTLLEAQLFGHIKGSFTDAVEDSPGLAAQADGGTLFLDEIGELTLSNQARVLRLIENREILKIGAKKPETVDARIIMATNRNLKEMVSNGVFREDLFYRINTFQLNIPPLRERPEDIAVLAAYLIKETTERYPKSILFTDEAIDELRKMPLKGNVRELRTLIERTVVLAQEGATVRAEDIKTAILRSSPTISFVNAWAGCDLEKEVEKYEAELLRLALKMADGKLTRAAQLLGITHQNLSAKLKGRYRFLVNERTIIKRRKKSMMTVKNVVRQTPSSKSKI